jgi:hypothetical protein
MKLEERIGVAALFVLLAGCVAPSGPSVSPAGASIAAPSASIMSKATASPLAYTWPAKLAPGTYTTGFIWDSPVIVTFTVPDGWESRNVEIFTDPVSRVSEVGGSRGRSVIFALVDNVYSDPCDAVLREQPVGPTVDDLAAALANLPGIDASAPEAATLAGYPGKYLEFSVSSAAGCELSRFHLWNSRPEWMTPSAHQGPPYFTAEREHYRIWILDVGGVRYVIGALSAADATEADLEELQGVDRLDRTQRLTIRQARPR